MLKDSAGDIVTEGCLSLIQSDLLIEFESIV